jgi:epoxide hydrolase 4
MSEFSKFQLSYVKANGINLHVAQIGSGPPVIFLHGFPEHWRAFAPMMDKLANTFACIAPDQRGNNLSDRPKGVCAYTIDTLADDIAGLLAALNLGRVHIVAHDWGGLVAWHFSSRHPQLLDKLVVFNAPHPFCLQQALNTDPAQREASRYAAQFAAVDSHDVVASKYPNELWTAFFGADEAKGRLNEDDKSAIISAWEPEGAWEAMLNWYRAAPFDYSGNAVTEQILPRPIGAPTLLVWGDADPLFTSSALRGLGEIAPKCQIKIIGGGGHCAFREDLEGCTQLVRDFLAMGYAE